MRADGTLKTGDHAEIIRGRYTGHRVIVGDVMLKAKGGNVLGVNGGEAEGWYPEHYLRKIDPSEVAAESRPREVDEPLPTLDSLADPRD